jgi:hypothetical protein
MGPTAKETITKYKDLTTSALDDCKYVLFICTDMLNRWEAFEDGKNTNDSVDDMICDLKKNLGYFGRWVYSKEDLEELIKKWRDWNELLKDQLDNFQYWLEMPCACE